jgi:hypothetical protein
MAVTEYERNQLFAWFEEHMGKERATTMMSLLPPVGWGDVATKRDLDHAIELLEARIDARFASLDDKLNRIEDRMVTRRDLEALRSDLQRTFVTWILTAEATVIGAVVGLVAVLH